MHRSLIIPACLFFLLIATGTIFYHNVEGWKMIDAFYFSSITMTTIGYGDFSPQTDMGKLFTVFYAFFSIGIAFYFFNLMGRYFLLGGKIERLKKEGRLNGKKGIRKIE
ncbi:MAG: potassium channel family protein [Candidatus Pacearchaeota archaeon]|jgi:hypothetical protein